MILGMLHILGLFRWAINLRDNISTTTIHNMINCSTHFRYIAVQPGHRVLEHSQLVLDIALHSHQLNLGVRSHPVVQEVCTVVGPLIHENGSRASTI